MRIIGLDFETANHNPGSICSAGVAVYEDEKLIEEHQWLVKPHKACDFFFEKFVFIHGITYWDVRPAPCFPGIWQSLRHNLESADLVVAHNAPFDMRMLDGILRQYNLPFPQFKFVCTFKAGKQAWPELEAHNLAALAEYLKLDLNHHNALSDAKASAKILMAIMNKFECYSIDKLQKVLKLESGTFSPEKVEYCVCI